MNSSVHPYQALMDLYDEALILTYEALILLREGGISEARALLQERQFIFHTIQESIPMIPPWGCYSAVDQRALNLIQADRQLFDFLMLTHKPTKD